MYVNESTIKLSDNDIKSVNLMFETAIKHNLIDLDSDILIDPL